MNRNPGTVRRLAGAAALLAGLAVASPAAAQQQPPQNPPDERGRPVEVVSRVLGLTEAQMAAWKGILDAAKAQSQPIGEQIRAKEKALGDLVRGGSTDAVAIGTLVIEIRGLRDQLRGIGDASVDSFLALLTGAQNDVLAEVEDAAALCPAVPAFLALHLIEPEHPGPPIAPSAPASPSFP